MNIVRRTGCLTIVALTAGWILAPAAADELPAPGEIRVFWTMEAVELGSDGWRPLLQFEDVLPLPDGGVLVVLRHELRASILIKLNREGKELWRIENSCRMSSCGRWENRDTVIVLPDGGLAILTTDGGEMRLFGKDGQANGNFEFAPERSVGFDTAVAGPDGSFFLASRMNGPDSGARLARWSPADGMLWQINLPLKAEGMVQVGRTVSLETLGSGDLLWTIQGEPIMTTGPSSIWQIRVSPTGAIRTSGRLETTLPAFSYRWQFSSVVMANGGVLRRLAQDAPRSHEHDPNTCRLEFWDRTGSLLIATMYDECKFRYLAAQGRHDFYMIETLEDDNQALVGFDSDLQELWYQPIPHGPDVVADLSSSRVYVFDRTSQDNESDAPFVIYVTSVE